MKVRATRAGWYNHRLREPGDEFVVTLDRHFSEKWMEKLGESAPKAPAVENKNDAVKEHLEVKDRFDPEPPKPKMYPDDSNKPKRGRPRVSSSKDVL